LWAAVLTACGPTVSSRTTTIETWVAPVSLEPVWAPTEDCDVRGSRSIENALLVGRSVALADRAGLPLWPLFGERLSRVIIVAAQSDELVPADDIVIIAVDADDQGHAIVQYMGLGYGNVYCAVMENGRITMGQPPLDARQLPRVFTRP
jgi:hypothetical protein